MNIADDSKLTSQLTTCSKEVFRTIIDLNEKVNAEYGNKPGNPIAFSHLVVSMCGWLSEMFPGHTSTIQLEGSYLQETGVVDLPNLVPVIEKLVQERKEQETRTLYPTKGDTAPMSQPITEQDVAIRLEEFIKTSKLVPDQMKALFIGRVTNWGNPVGAHPVGQESTEKPAPTAEVARTPDTTEPLTMSITRDDDGHMCIAIADRKWKIMRHGIIGNGAADREEFHQAASDLVDNDLPFSDAGLESVVLSSQLLEMKDQSRAYRDAMKYRSAIDQTLGHVMYEAYCRALPSSEEKQKLTKWNDVVFKWAWEEAALAAYFSVGLDPDEINKEIQIIAARQRIRLLQQAYFVNGDIGERAAHINALAGPTPQPNP